MKRQAVHILDRKNRRWTLRSSYLGNRTFANQAAALQAINTAADDAKKAGQASEIMVQHRKKRTPL